MTVELEITDVAFGGKGVGRHNGKAVFVPYVIDGETVSARVVREHKKFIEGELESVLTSSPHRVESRCPYFGRCGGCVYQHVDYEHQLALKWQQVKETLRRIGKAERVPMRPLIPSPLQYEYRNRITVHVQEGVIGFFRRESNSLLDIERCPISSPLVNVKLAELRAGHPRDGDYTVREKVDRPVRARSTRLGSASEHFIQTNDAVATSLLDLVDRLISSPVDLLIDGYCGAGFFSKRLRSRCKKVIGIDWDRRAIAQARRDAGPNEEYYAGEVDIELPRILADQVGAVEPPAGVSRAARQQVAIIIVDPPAAGLSESVRRALLTCPPAQLIYVSCDPGTLARDLLALTETFRCESITPLDMFPQTAEIEVVAELCARRSGPR